MKKYFNGHAHTYYSNTTTPDVIISPLELVNRTLELGHTAITATEHGNTLSKYELYELAQKNGLKYIYGVEAYFVIDSQEKDSSNGHIVIYAINDNGYKQINEIISHANTNGFYYKPRIDLKDIEKLNENDIIITTACVGGFLNKDRTKTEFLIDNFERFIKNGNFFLEVAYHDTDKQKEYNEFLLKLSIEKTIPLIFGADTHIIELEDSKYRDAFLLSKGISYEDEYGWMIDFPSREEAFMRFKNQGILSDDLINQCIDNTLLIEDKIVGYEILKDKSMKLPIIESMRKFSQDTRDKEFVDIVWKEYPKKIKNLSIEEDIKYRKQIEFEIDEILGCGMADYFIFNYNMIKLGKEKYNGVLTYTGRGSAASYLICMILGFTTIDRNKYSVPILPERFITKDRILLSKTPPDIDFNVSQPKSFYRAQQELLGKESTYPMIALGRLKEKSAWKIYAKANNVNFETANAVSAQIEEYEKAKKYDNPDEHIDDEEYSPIDVKDYISPEYWDLYIESNRFLGVVTDLKIHPCAFLVCNTNAKLDIGLIKAKDNMCVAIEGKNAEKYGYLKNDLLTVSVVDLIDKIYKKIGIQQHTTTELLEITLNDDKTWDIYKNGLTIEINQMAKPNTRDKGKQFNPRNITDLSTIIAGIRPSAKSIEGKILNREKYTIGIKEIDDMLFEHTGTGSFLLYQESIMKILEYSGMPSKNTYDIIKAIAKKKKDVISSSEQMFVDGLIKKMNNVNGATIAKNFWKVINDAAAYGFNASHSLSVAFDSLYGAYLKANYPYEFYSTCLEYYSSSDKRDLAKIALLKKESAEFGIIFEPLKYGRNNTGFVIDKTNGIIGQSLSGIKGINETIGKQIFDLYKEKNIKNIVDLIFEIKTNEELTINKRHWTQLSKINYFSEISEDGKKIEILPDLYDILYKKQFKDATIISINNKLKELFEEKKITPIYIDMDFVKKYCNRSTAKLNYMDNQKDFIKDFYSKIEKILYSDLEYILNTFEALGYVGEESSAVVMDVNAVSHKNGSALLHNPITSGEKWCGIKTAGLKKGIQIIITKHKKGKRKGEIIIEEFIKLG